MQQDAAPTPLRQPPAFAPRVSEVIGRSLGGYGVRQEFGITVVGVKAYGQDFTYATPSTVLREGAEIIVSGPKDKVEKFSALGDDGLRGPRTERRNPGPVW